MKYLLLKCIIAHKFSIKLARVLGFPEKFRALYVVPTFYLSEALDKNSKRFDDVSLYSRVKDSFNMYMCTNLILKELSAILQLEIICRFNFRSSLKYIFVLALKHIWTFRMPPIYLLKDILFIFVII